MEQTYSIPTWFFTRSLCVIYFIAFASLWTQAKGLWGSHGVQPLAPYMKSIEQSTDSHRYWQVPSVFWLSTSDEFIEGVTITGMVFAGLALIGFAQGWSLLMCFALYLSFCTSGQEFMSFQWDSLLLEVGFLAFFVVPWNFDFTFSYAEEPHWFVRGMFYVVLFKLMFLSGVVKLMSGDESWRDLTALKYHFWTQPLPNPVSPFMHALPEWVHQISSFMTFLIELILPFGLFWKPARTWVALGFIVLSGFIFLTGNYTFFNLLTITLCFWLIPDRLWERLMQFIPLELHTAPANMFPHPVTTAVMGGMAFVSLLWCLAAFMPDMVVDLFRPILNGAQTLRISNSYGLFAVMTKTRPEIVFEGSLDGQNWKEYEFKFKPGPLDRMPPVIEPFQPRLDWQLWFAALGNLRSNPWVETLMLRMFEGSADVAEFFSKNPFEGAPPQFLRARLYEYEFTTPEEIVDNEVWWTRKPIGDYTPTFTRPKL